jgi:hypothetical protein
MNEKLIKFNEKKVAVHFFPARVAGNTKNLYPKEEKTEFSR